MSLNVFITNWKSVFVCIFHSSTACLTWKKWKLARLYFYVTEDKSEQGEYMGRE